MTVEQVTVGGVALGVAIVVRRDADEHAGARAGEAIHALACILQRFPCHFEQQPMLWVDVRRFARRHSEEPGVPLIDVIDESTPLQIRATGLGGIRIVHLHERRAVRRNVSDRIDAVA